MMSSEAMYVLLLVLTGFIGFIVGIVTVLWTFARDKTIQRITDEDVVVKKKDLEQITRRQQRYPFSDDD